MNIFLLNYRIRYVEKIIARKKWNMYILRLKIISKMRVFPFKRKQLSLNECEETLQKIDKRLESINVKNRCLIKSMVGMIYLYKKIKNVNLNIGIKILPFAAHAWISIKGIPICEYEDIKQYKKIVLI